MTKAPKTGARARPGRAVPTIHDVARAAGVTIGTASQALNGRGKMRPETRERVREAAALLEYRPNDLMQSLLRGRSCTVGLLSTDRYGRFSIPLLEGIEDALDAAQMSVFLCDARDDPAHERQHIDSLLAKQVDGIIVTGRRIDARPPIDVGRAAVPVLYAFAQVTDPQALCLIPDDAQGGRLATEHLLRAGRRRLAHVTGPRHFECVRARQKGMEQVLWEHSLDLPAHRVFSGPWQEAWGYEAAACLLDVDPWIDAIVCGADLLARGVVDALRERGVRVPDDVAVVGFDNWEIMADGSRPPLTTIDMNLHDLGRRAGTRLLAMIDGEKDAGVVRTPCRLVVRASCGASMTSVV
jgi:LacI family transcriptional regulator